MIDHKVTAATIGRPHMVWVQETDTRGRTRLVSRWVQAPATAEELLKAHAA